MLEDERAQFRGTLPTNLAELWEHFRGRIAVVLSGGGAREYREHSESRHYVIKTSHD